MFLTEYQNPTAINTELLEDVDPMTGIKKKNLYMKGIFIQGNIKNANQRVYPVHEIKQAVNNITEQIKKNVPIYGQLDHPDDLKISLDRVSHAITEMWMEGFDGFGKLKILETPMGNIAKAILESGCKLGVSSRGSGDVNEATGQVSGFDIITVDIVAQPSAPNAWPKPIYESLLNMRNGHSMIELASEAQTNKKYQKYFQNEIARFISDLKI